MKNRFINFFSKISETYFYCFSIIFVMVSFLHLSEDRFWDLIAYAIIASGLQEVINNTKT